MSARDLRLPGALTTMLLLLAGCGYSGANSLPLPGAIGGDDTYSVTVVLDTATNLVPRETCRSNDVVIGSVESVTLNANLKPEVVCRVKNSVSLPENVVATLSETSLLGERYVALDTPEPAKPIGILKHGATVPTSSTRIDPDVETVLGALSQVLNGGSLGKIQTITRELGTALHTSDAGKAIDSMAALTKSLNSHRTDIVDSLEAVNRLSVALAKQKTAIAGALHDIPVGLSVLQAETPKIMEVLAGLQNVSRTAVPLINRIKTATVADLKHLDPVISELSKSGYDLALLAERALTFPFASNAAAILRGDYGGAMVNISFDLDAFSQLLMPLFGDAPGPSPAVVPAPKSPKPPKTLGEILGLDSSLATLFPGLSGLLGSGTP